MMQCFFFPSQGGPNPDSLSVVNPLYAHYAFVPFPSLLPLPSDSVSHHFCQQMSLFPIASSPPPLLQFLPAGLAGGRRLLRPAAALLPPPPPPPPPPLGPGQIRRGRGQGARQEKGREEKGVCVCVLVPLAKDRLGKGEELPDRA